MVVLWKLPSIVCNTCFLVFFQIMTRKRRQRKGSKLSQASCVSDNAQNDSNISVQPSVVEEFDKEGRYSLQNEFVKSACVDN